jgi:TrmH family RNA methyltransferase
MSDFTSLQHPLVKELVRLRRDKAARLERGSFLIEGYKQVVEICGKLAAKCLLVADDQEFNLSTIRADVVYRVPPAVIAKITGMAKSEGIVAEVPLPAPGDLGHCKKLLVLDGVADPGNLGSLLRTAHALQWDGVFFLGDCVDPFNDKAVRAAKGALFNIPYAAGGFSELAALLESVQAAVWIADARGVALDRAKGSGRLALVLGNEGRGVSDRVRLLGQMVAIPMAASAESLNVAAAGAILMHNLKVCDG